MAQSQIDLYNLALSACGATGSVATIFETGVLARTCNRWYEPVRLFIFRSAHWACLTRHARLGLLVERDTTADWVSTDPQPGWIYAYGAPSDMVAARHLTDYSRFGTGVYVPTNVPAIFTDTEDAILTYTADVTDVSLWDVGLYMALVYGLAMHIARPLTGKRERSRDLMESANMLIAQARADSANEQAGVQDSLPEWIEARGYAGGINRTRYIAPFGQMLTATGAPVV